MIQKKLLTLSIILLFLFSNLSPSLQKSCYYQQKKQQKLKSLNLQSDSEHNRILNSQQQEETLNLYKNRGKPVVEQVDNRRKLGTSWDDLEIEETPKSIRITTDYSMADKNAAKFDQIENAVKIAVQYFSEILYVYPEAKKIKVQNDKVIRNGYYGICPEDQDFDSIPSSHIEDGVETDLLIYIKSVTQPDQDYVAYAFACQWHHDRPTVGMIVFNESFLPASNDQLNFDSHVETAIHELFHVLGFDGDMIKNFRTVDGKRIHVSQNNFIQSQTVRGLKTNLISSPLVKKYNQKYFDCSSAKGAQLENEGDQGSAGSHWERLMFINEMMNPSLIQSDAVTSIMTLAFLKDSNWYADVNLDLAEDMQWGKNQGCDFLNTCSTNFEEISNDSSACTFHRFSVGTSGVEDFTDDCPTILENEDFQCTDTNDSSPNQSDTYDVFSLTSKCFEASIRESGSTVSQNQRCYQYECDSSNNVVITITKNSVDYTVTCSSNGQTVNAPSGSGLTGTLTCPSDLSLFCDFPTPCEDYCSGKGYCLQQNGDNECHCIDGYSGNKCQYSCQSGQYYENGSCVDSCSTDFYLDNVSNTCEPCSSTCSSGYCNENGCLDCPQGKYKNGSNCVSSCPTGKYPDASSGTCKECDSKCENGCIRKSNNCLVVPFLYTDPVQLHFELLKNPTGIIEDMNSAKLAFNIFILAFVLVQIFI